MNDLHKNAALTISQRKLVRQLYLEGAPISSLARRFNVNRKCAQRWAKRNDPTDRPSGPQHSSSVITDQYREAVIAHRMAHPDHGAITIAYHLQDRFSFANRGTVQRILNEQGLSKREARRPKTPKN